MQCNSCWALSEIMCWQWTDCSCYCSGWSEVTPLCSSLSLLCFALVAKTPVIPSMCFVCCWTALVQCQGFLSTLPQKEGGWRALIIFIHKSYCLSLNFGWGEWAKGRVAVWLLARSNPGQELVTCPTWQWTIATYRTGILRAASCFGLLYLPNIDISFVVCSWLCLRNSLRQTGSICQFTGTVLAVFVFMFH